ncbi:hypothetical protein DICPUDRAFT_93225 [Dictyostelium purpureum]|uniref:Uncharacterized protein n=1 Tax=Dictyostelium purpureum TaxID=5786 RepID=F1A446_DICPU|nr:uncharacterized protein DICPUDRAFT_93225 [Dictyostelium purpureum]EGC29030.1 hypothetical protein DICPUDRAFT_93225 [Dictyostelium purpureum]|eukprot:XP_003294440.1 hypothetical protein DICPUDRAFT_93225 [Dictyostelium purpureum]
MDLNKESEDKIKEQKHNDQPLEDEEECRILSLKRERDLAIQREIDFENNNINICNSPRLSITSSNSTDSNQGSPIVNSTNDTTCKTSSSTIHIDSSSPKTFSVSTSFSPPNFELDVSKSNINAAEDYKRKREERKKLQDEADRLEEEMKKKRNEEREKIRLERKQQEEEEEKREEENRRSRNEERQRKREQMKKELEMEEERIKKQREERLLRLKSQIAN